MDAVTRTVQGGRRVTREERTREVRQRARERDVARLEGERLFGELIKLGRGIEALKWRPHPRGLYGEYEPIDARCDALDEAKEKVRELMDKIRGKEENEDVHERETGKWKKGGYCCGETEWICPKCNASEWRTNRVPFCPWCGNPMEVEE